MTDDADTVSCPYSPCGGWVNILPTKPYPTIEVHMMPNYLGGSQPCPASLMSWPLTDRAKELLDERRQAVRPHILMAYEREMERRGDEAARPSRPPGDQSRSLRGPHRLGREPDDPESDDWYLGGRQSEELLPSDATDKPPANPGPGHALGRGSTMPSIGESAGFVNAAGGEGAAARIALDEAIHALERATALIADINAAQNAPLLTDALSFYQKALADAQSAQGNIDIAHDKGQQFIARLLS